MLKHGQEGLLNYLTPHRGIAMLLVSGLAIAGFSGKARAHEQLGTRSPQASVADMGQLIVRLWNKKPGKVQKIDDQTHPGGVELATSAAVNGTWRRLIVYMDQTSGRPDPSTSYEGEVYVAACDKDGLCGKSDTWRQETIVYSSGRAWDGVKYTWQRGEHTPTQTVAGSSATVQKWSDYDDRIAHSIAAGKLQLPKTIQHQ